MKQLFIITLLLVLAGMLPVQAQEAGTAVSPAFQHIITKPGKEFLLELNMTNTADPQLYTGTLLRVGEPDILGNLKVLPDQSSPITVTPEDDVSTFDTPELIRSKNSKRIPLRITVPETTPEGEYAFVYNIRTEPGLPNSGTVTVQLSHGTGALILITVSKDGVDNKRVRTVLFKGLTPVTLPVPGGLLHLVDVKQPIPFILSIGNTGKYTVYPTGQLVFRKNGKTIDQQTFLPTYVFPDSQRIVPVRQYEMQDCRKSFGDLCREDISYIHPGLPIGFYNAIAEINYGENAPMTYSRDYFLVIPFGFTLGLLGSCLLIIVLLGGYLWFRIRQSKTLHHPHGRAHRSLHR